MVLALGAALAVCATAFADDTDTATYYWKAGVASGDWSDPANWEPSVQDDDHRYPDSTQCTVSFQRADPSVR